MHKHKKKERNEKKFSAISGGRRRGWAVAFRQLENCNFQSDFPSAYILFNTRNNTRATPSNPS